MKNCLTHLAFAVCSLSIASSAFAAWQEIGQNEQTVVLVDTATLARNGNLAQIKSMLSFKKAGTDPKTGEVVNSIVGLNEYDCSTGQYRPLEVKLYPTRDGKDVKVVPPAKPPYVFEAEKTPDSAFIPVENGSWAAGVFNVACRSK